MSTSGESGNMSVHHPTGYQMFVKECIKELKARYPINSLQVELPVLLRMCRDKWEELDQETREEFNSAASTQVDDPTLATK